MVHPDVFIERIKSQAFETHMTHATAARIHFCFAMERQALNHHF